MDFKHIIRKLRNEKGLNTTQLAGQFEKTEAAIRAWESGRAKPDADTLIKLSEYFECSTDYLLGLTEYRNSAEQYNQKKAATKSVGSLEKKIRELNSRSQEELANAFTNTINILVGLPSQSDAAVQELINVTEYIGEVYERIAQQTAEWNEQNLLMLVSECFTYKKNIDIASIKILEKYVTKHIKNIDDEGRKKYLAKLILGFFPENEILKSLVKSK